MRCGQGVACWTAKREFLGSTPGDCQGRNLIRDLCSMRTPTPPLGLQISGYQSQSQAWNSPRVRKQVERMGAGRPTSVAGKCVDAIRSEWTIDSCEIADAHKTYTTDHFIQRSERTTSTSVHVRLHPVRS